MAYTQHLFRHSWIPCCCIVLFCLPVLGCYRDSWLKPFGYDRASFLKKYTPPEDEALARHCVDLLLQDRFDEIEGLLDPSLRNADTRKHLAELSYLFPSKPKSVKMVDASVVRGDNFSTTSLTLEYEFERSWLLAKVVIQTKDGRKTITGFWANPTAQPVEKNEFTLADKGISQYAALFLAMCVGGLTSYAFFLCVRMKVEKRKWIWQVAILLGILRITVNWTTGEWFFNPFAIQIPPVMAFSTLYGPWTLQIGAPLGAIAFLRLRKQLISEVTPPTTLHERGP